MKKIKDLIKEDINRNIEYIDVRYELNNDGAWKETVLKVKRRNLVKKGEE